MTDIQEIEQALKDLIANGDVPSRVTNRLLLAAIIQTREQLELRIEELEAKMNDNPPLVLMFKRRPALFLRYLLLITFIIVLLVTAAIAKDDIAAFFISILGAL
jgi:hypothetical protein